MSAQHSGYLTVLEVLSSPRRYRCLCDPARGGCGREKTILASNLKRTYSCGCLNREVSTKRIRKTHKAHKARYKRDEKKRDKDGWWLALRLAARYAKRGKSTLVDWKGYCSLLGRGIRTRSFEDWRGELQDYYSLADLNIIRDRQAGPEPEPENTVGWDGAVEQVGACRQTIKKLLKTNPERVQGKRSDGRPCQKARLSKREINAIAKWRRQMTIPQAAKYLELSDEAVYKFIEDGLLHVLRDPYGGERYQRLDRAEVKKLKKARENKDDVSTVGGKNYLPFRLAGARYPHATSKILYTYRNKRCPELQGGVLHAKQFGDTVHRAQGMKPKKWKWLEDDLMELEEGKVGKPGQVLAAEARNGEGADDGPLLQTAESSTKAQKVLVDGFTRNGQAETLALLEQSKPRVVIDSENRERNQYCYEQMTAGVNRAAIRLKIKERTDWNELDSDPGVTLAAQQHATSSGKPWPIVRNA